MQVTRQPHSGKWILKAGVSILWVCVLLGAVLASVQPWTAACADEQEPECWAVIVGVRAQQDSPKCVIDAAGNMYPMWVKYPDDNAQDLARELGAIWGEDHVRLLLNREATKVGIYYAIKWLADMAEANDTVLFHFSGHGGPGCLCCYDGLISDSDLADWLGRLDSESAVIIIESCYAGSFGTKLCQDGRVVLLSWGPDESSFEDPELRHGVFGHYTLQALDSFDIADTNHDYELSAEEIFDYAEPRTVNETIKPYANEPPWSKGDEQHPILYDPHYSSELRLSMKVVFDTDARLPPDTTVLTVDEKPYLSGELPDCFTWAAGSVHQVTGPAKVDIGQGKRLVFVSWDDGESPASRAVSHGGKYTANYKTQYRLTVESACGDPAGQGWYDSGSKAPISVSSPKGTIIRQVFTGWSGDHAGPGATASVTMDGSRVVTANWRTEYVRLYLLVAGILALVASAAGAYVLWKRRGSPAE